MQRIRFTDPGGCPLQDESAAAWTRRLQGQGWEPTIHYDIEVDEDGPAEATLTVELGHFNAVHRIDLRFDRPLTKPPTFRTLDGSEYVPRNQAERRRASYGRIARRVQALLADLYASDDFDRYCAAEIQARETWRCPPRLVEVPPSPANLADTKRAHLTEWGLDEAPRSRRGRKPSNVIRQAQREERTGDLVTVMPNTLRSATTRQRARRRRY